MLSWAQQQGERLQAQRASLAAEREEMAQLVDWITAAEEALSLRDQEPLPEEAEQLEELHAQHAVRAPQTAPCHAGGSPSSPCPPGTGGSAQPHRGPLGAFVAAAGTCTMLRRSGCIPELLLLLRGMLMQEPPGLVGGRPRSWLQPSAPAVLAGGGHAWGTLWHSRWMLSTGLLWQVFMEELNRKQPDVEKVTKSCKQKLATELGPPSARRLATRKSPFAPTLRPGPPAVPSPLSVLAAGRRSVGKAQGAPAVPLGGLEPQTPLMAQLLHRWQQLWLLALDRQYRLETALQRLREVGAVLQPWLVPAAPFLCMGGDGPGVSGTAQAEPGAFPDPVPTCPHGQGVTSRDQSRPHWSLQLPSATPSWGSWVPFAHL